jgi:hypothetical protein
MINKSNNFLKNKQWYVINIGYFNLKIVKYRFWPKLLHSSFGQTCFETIKIYHFELENVFSFWFLELNHQNHNVECSILIWWSRKRYVPQMWLIQGNPRRLIFIFYIVDKICVWDNHMILTIWSRFINILILINQSTNEKLKC